MPYTIKTTVYLNDKDYDGLKRIAQRGGRSAAELVREAVGEYVRRHRLRRQPHSLGAGRSRRGDLSERAEELLTGIGR